MTATDAEWRDFSNVEGLPLAGGIGRARALESGAEGILFEIRYDAGTRSPEHAHTHDSYIYLLEGHLTGTIAGTPVELQAGQTTFHPTGVLHTVEAVEDSKWLEFKAPPQPGWR
jgi:quercetin dioxygenase-like cupin family protein